MGFGTLVPLTESGGRGYVLGVSDIQMAILGRGGSNAKSEAAYCMG